MKKNDLKQAGLKNTLPRKLILDLLQESHNRHLSAEDIYRTLLARGENIGLATVYRVLAQFESAGLITRHHFEGTTAVFELSCGTHHDHLICMNCGAIIEFINEDIEKQQRKVAENEGFILNDHALYIFGTCKDPEHCPRRLHKHSAKDEDLQ
jgi:Fur family transcriptional regulator, ferric uptake regulator